MVVERGSFGVVVVVGTWVLEEVVVVVGSEEQVVVVGTEEPGEVVVVVGIGVLAGTEERVGRV